MDAVTWWKNVKQLFLRNFYFPAFTKKYFAAYTQ